MEIHYRAKSIGGSSWGTEKNVTVEDTNSTNPGHPSITTYLDTLQYVNTLVAYASQKTINYPNLLYLNEYKGRTFDWSEGQWEMDFHFISPSDDDYFMPPSQGGGVGGAKTGNLVYNGDSIVFACWPYRLGSDANGYRVLYYRLMIDEDWGNASRILGTDTAYYGQDVCPYPLPNHDVQLVYARSNDGNTFNVYSILYDHSDDTFDSLTAVTNVSSGVRATMPYLLCEDRGAGKYVLHLVWEEKYSTDSYRALYTRFDSDSGWKNYPDTLESSNGRQPSVAVTPQGLVMVVWNDKEENHL
jgi:hypothetical protein